MDLYQMPVPTSASPATTTTIGIHAPDAPSSSSTPVSSEDEVPYAAARRNPHLHTATRRGTRRVQPGQITA
ncbi:MAG: hypothetical protein ACRD1S_08075 [Vicinamibacterales bacterium]